MIATIASIMALAAEVISTANTLIKLKQDVTPSVEILKKLFSGDSITEDELADMRARNDVLHAGIQSQTESGQ